MSRMRSRSSVDATIAPHTSWSSHGSSRFARPGRGRIPRQGHPSGSSYGTVSAGAAIPMRRLAPGSCRERNGYSSRVSRALGPGRRRRSLPGSRLLEPCSVVAPTSSGGLRRTRPIPASQRYRAGGRAPEPEPGGRKQERSFGSVRVADRGRRGYRPPFSTLFVFSPLAGPSIAGVCDAGISWPTARIVDSRARPTTTSIG